MSEKKPCVLVVDDDPLQLELLEAVLECAGFTVVTTSSPMGVSNTVRSARPDFVLVDLDLPAIPGERLVQLARPHAPKGTVFILYSGCELAELRTRAERIHADGWISKSTAPRELATQLRRIRAARTRADAGARPS